MAVVHLAPPGFFPPFDVSIDAVCMEGAKASYKVQGVAFTTMTLIVKQTVECPRKKSVVGGGPGVSGPASLSYVAVTKPYDNKDKGKVPTTGGRSRSRIRRCAELDVVVYATCVYGEDAGVDSPDRRANSDARRASGSH